MQRSLVVLHRPPPIRGRRQHDELAQQWRPLAEHSTNYQGIIALFVKRIESSIKYAVLVGRLVQNHNCACWYSACPNVWRFQIGARGEGGSWRAENGLLEVPGADIGFIGDPWERQEVIRLYWCQNRKENQHCLPGAPPCLKLSNFKANRYIQHHASAWWPSMDNKESKSWKPSKEVRKSRRTSDRNRSWCQIARSARNDGIDWSKIGSKTRLTKRRLHFPTAIKPPPMSRIHQQSILKNRTNNTKQTSETREEYFRHQITLCCGR